MKRSGVFNSRKLARAFGMALSAALLTCGLTSAHAANFDEIKKRGYIIAVTEDDFPPFEFIRDGKPVGLDHALGDIFRKEGPMELRQQPIPFQGLLAGVVTGKYDLALSAISITEERSKSLDFSRPIAESTYFYVKRTGDDRIKSIKDLSGLKVAVTQGSAMESFMPELDEKLKALGGKLGEVMTYASYPEAYQDLANGRVDYVVNSVVGLATLAREQPDKFTLGEALSGRAYHAWAVAKGNTELLNMINEFLDKVAADGRLEALQKEWLGTTFPDMPKEPRLPGDKPIP